MRKPVVEIIGADGSNLVPAWQSRLVEVTFLDNDGGEADEISFTFSVDPPFPPSPPEGQRFRMLYGWDANRLRDAGTFTYQSDELFGDPETGNQMRIVARSSDFVDADKAVAKEHFENTTVGEIIQTLAGRSGKSAIVDKAIAAIKVPYRLRYNQSLAGFVEELASEFGGSPKFANDMILVGERNSGKTAGGLTMPTIVAEYREGQAFSIGTESKGKYKDVGADWFDPLSGVTNLLKAAGIGAASALINLHPARSQAEAEYAGKAQGKEAARDTVGGSVTSDGNVDAMAGAPVQLRGYGSRDNAQVIAASIEHIFTFDESGGWIMDLELASREGK